MRALIGADGEFESVHKQPNYKSGDVNRWNRVCISLDKYVGKIVQIKFIATCNNATYTLLDCISLSSFAQNDIRVAKLETPEAGCQ